MPGLKDALASSVLSVSLQLHSQPSVSPDHKPAAQIVRLLPSSARGSKLLGPSDSICKQIGFVAQQDAVQRSARNGTERRFALRHRTNGHRGCPAPELPNCPTFPAVGAVTTPHQTHALWTVLQSCSVAEIDPNVLAEFNALAQEAAELRRQSYGLPMHRRGTKEGGRAAAQLSHRLLAIHHVVESHPELQDHYREWRRLHPTFISDQEDR